MINVVCVCVRAPGLHYIFWVSVPVTVDDFMVGEDFDDSDEPPEKPDTDSDFEVDEEDSGSDWERGRGSQKV